MKLYVFTSVIFFYMLVEFIVGEISESVALKTDALHMFNDFLALVIATVSKKIADTKTKNKRYSYGLQSMKTVGGFFNSCFLLINLLWLARENIEKFISLSEDNINDNLRKNIDTVLIVSSIGAFINIIGLVFFHSHDHENSHDHNTKGIMLHLFTDFFGSIVVIISSLIIKFTYWEYRFFLDPVGSCLVICLLFPITLKLLIDTTKILLNKTTRDIDIESLISEIKDVEGIKDIHDLHIWSSRPGVNIASMHIITKRKGVLKEIKEILHKYNIHSSSIQREREECPEPYCKTGCDTKRCCEN